MGTNKDRRRKILRFISCGIPATFLYCGPIACQAPEKEPSSSCQDLSDLKESELAVRDQLGYVDQSGFEDRSCKNCQLFVKADKDSICGNCLAMKGPVMDQGYCTVWAPIMG